MKRRLAFILASLSLGAALLMGLKSASSVVAFRALEEGDYIKAMELFLINNDHSGVGMVYYQMKQYDEAIRHFEKASDESGIGLAFCGKKKFDEAIKRFTKKNDNSGLGLAYCGKRDFKNAEKYFLKANDRAGLGLVALHEKDYDKARKLFDQAKDKNGLGLVLLAEKKYDEALTHFTKNDNNSGIGMALLGKKEFDSAIPYFIHANDFSGLSLAYCGKKEFDKAIAFAEKANDLSALSHAYCGKGEYDKAIECATQANDLTALGYVYCAKREFDKAIEYFQQDKDDTGLCLAFCGKKNFDKAIEYAEKANDLSALGHAYCGKKQFDKALEYFTQANDLTGLSLVFNGKKQFDKALEYAVSANDLKAQGLIYCGKKEYDRAIDFFEDANDDSGLSLAYCGKREFDTAIAHALTANDLSALAHAYCGKNEFNKAVEYFQQANDDSGLSYAFCGKKEFDKAISYATQANDNTALGYAYCGKNDFSTAIQYFEKANDNTGLSHAYNGKNDYAKAIEYAEKANDDSAKGYAQLKFHYYDKALESFQKDNNLSGIGLVYAKQKEFEKALYYAKKSNDLSLKGNILLGLGEIRKAEELFIQANDISGQAFVKMEEKKYEDAWRMFEETNDLAGQGLVHSEKGDYAKAEECFNKANDMSGLGRIALKRRKLNTAVEYFKKANDFDGMGDLNWHLRDFNKAIEYFKKEGNHVKIVQSLQEKRHEGYDEAIKYARALINEGKYVNQLYIELGKIYYELKEYDKAIKEFEKIADSGSYYTSEALLWIGNLYYYQKKYDLAENTFQRVIDDYPNTRFYKDAVKSLKTAKYLKEIQKRKNQEVAQLTLENRCGPNSLNLLLASQGIKTTPEEIAKLAGTDKEGTTMLGLKQAAEKKGCNLSALKLTISELPAYKGNAILLLDRNHYVYFKDVINKEIILADSKATENISLNKLHERWQGETLALSKLTDAQELALAEIQKIKGGNRRPPEGGISKNDPGLHPSGYPLIDYGKIVPHIPLDYTLMYNFDSSMTGYSPSEDGGLSSSFQNSNGVNSSTNCETTTDPISITGGQIILPYEEINIPGLGKKTGMSLRLQRTYSSRSEEDGPLGFGWAVYPDVTLAVLPPEEPEDPEKVMLKLPDGTNFSYLDSLQNYYYGPQCDGSSLGKDADGTYTWVRWTLKFGKQTYEFDVNNRLQFIKDPSGVRHSYTRDSSGRITRIYDGSNRYMQFYYNGAGKIYKVSLVGHIIVNYYFYYDSNHNLIRVTGPEGYNIRYEYNDPFDIHNITAVIDSNNKRTEFVYNEEDCCVKVTDAEGNIAEYEYNFLMGSTTVKEARIRPDEIYDYEIGKITHIVDSNGETTEYTYDENYIRNSSTDVNGNHWQWINEYMWNNCLQFTDAEGYTTNVEYHPEYHSVTKLTDVKGREWSYLYDISGHVKERITPAPHGAGTAHLTHEYNSYGNRTKTTDPEGIITQYEYDSYGNVTKVIDGEGNYIENTYDRLSRLTSFRYGTDQPTTYEYDYRNRLKKITYPDGSYEEYSYDANDNLLTFRDANGHITTNEYNGLNQMTKMTDPEGIITEYEYDVAGNVTKITRYDDGRPLITQIEYNDHYMRKTKVIEPDGNITEYTYEDSPPLLRSGAFTTMRKYKSDGTPLAVQTRVYDKNYRVKEIRDGLSNATVFAYDEVGNLVSVTDANGNVTTYEYDPDCNVRTAEVNPLSKWTEYTYYKNGKLKTKTDANGNTINYEYDLAGKLKKITYPDLTFVEYQYNQYGKVSQMIDQHGTTTYSYNERGWLTSVDSPEANDTVSYTYDYVGNRTGMTAGTAGVFSYSYLNNDLLQSITNPQSQVTTFAYDTAGRKMSMTYANGVKTEWQYYDDDTIKDLAVKNSLQQVLASYHYAYNTMNQLVNVTDNAGKVDTYSYDDAFRLVHEDRKDASQQVMYSRDYSYDPLGNRLSEVRDGVNISYSYNGFNQTLSRVSPFETISFVYDDNGNMVTETSSLNGTKSYSYDYVNRLTRVDLPSGSYESYSYAGDGMRTSLNNNGTVKKFIYDGLLPVIERDSLNNILAAYTKIPGAPGGIGGLISSFGDSASLFYHDSHLGNVNLLTDGAEAILQSYEYDGFGNVTAESGTQVNAYKYKTKEASEETGLVFFGARYYNPLLGRFINPDLLGMVDGPNVYQYCSNDPIVLIDPWGFASVVTRPVKKLGKTVGRHGYFRFDDGSTAALNRDDEKTNVGPESNPLSEEDEKNWSKPACVDEDKLKKAVEDSKANNDPNKDDVDGKPYDTVPPNTNNSNDWINRRLKDAGGKTMLDYRGGWLE